MLTVLRPKQTILTLASLFFVMLGLAQSGTALDRYPRPNLFQMIGDAKFIAIGKIVAIKPLVSYTFEVEAMLRGDQPETIEIQQVRDSCQQRHFDYAVNQRLIVLLQEDLNGKLRPVAAYGGETRIDGDQVICDFDFPNAQVEVPGPRSDTRVPLVDLKRAIVEFPELFRPASNPAPIILSTGFRPRYSAPFRKYVNRSAVHQLLAAQARAAGIR